MQEEYTIEAFLELRKNKRLADWTSGVYLVSNKSKNKHYVGKSINVKDRLFTHFSGRGNGDIYADYLHNDIFSVRFYKFNDKQFRDIDELEYHLIRIYEASTLGYNRQQGNNHFKKSRGSTVTVG